ncbi:MAG: peptidase S10, partial [Verrucomicrobia bacterium]|nr:peptidase S10 [Verrucomicrobiota bacterium]
TAIVATGKVSSISYVQEKGENRPITFVFNGGPGASSVWLHMAALGPRIVVGPEEGGSLTPPYKIADNLNTLLDLTDLVFIDPSGTGLSAEDDANYSLQGDIRSVGDFIRDYLTEHSRWNSPKYMAGESYGALRAIGVADYVHNEYGIYFNGMVLISAAIDYQVLLFAHDNPFPPFLFLPTYATTAWHHGKAHTDLSLEEVAEKARAFAYQIYGPALLYPRCADLKQLYPQIAAMTGLCVSDVKQWRGKMDDDAFLSLILKDEEQIVGRYDTRYTGCIGGDDPSVTQIDGPIAAIFHDYLNKELGFKASYTLFSNTVHAKWRYRNDEPWGYPNVLSALRQVCKTNPSMKLFVGCGYFDLATPFASVEYCIDHLDVPHLNLRMKYYEGGHMYYTNPKARAQFKQDLIDFYR